jgi:RimJ/RimL family protein N-acetyltransferase
MELHPTYPIVTERLRLRPLTTADVPALVSYRGRADICRYLPFEPMTRTVLMGRLAGDFARTEITQPGQGLTLGVELAGPESAGLGVTALGDESAEGLVIGDVVLMFHSAEHRGGEIGYVFAPRFHGHGYATEAVAAMIDLAFAGLGLHRVVARIDARNVASARLAERLGLRREAHFVRNEMFKGEWTDELVYAVLADDWPSPAA